MSLCVSLFFCLCLRLSLISITMSLSLFVSVLKTIFKVNLGYLVFIEAQNDGSYYDNWSTADKSCGKLQSIQIITSKKPTFSFFYTGCPSRRPTNSVKALNGKTWHSIDLLTQACSPIFRIFAVFNYNVAKIVAQLTTKMKTVLSVKEQSIPKPSKLGVTASSHWLDLLL